MIGALTYVAFLPNSIFDSFTVMLIQLYYWLSKQQLDFKDLAASGILVLLALLPIMNISAVIIRNKYQKNQ